jgi:hypothetical protein
MRGLRSSKGRIRKMVGQVLRTRNLPEFFFKYDAGIERSVKLGSIIDRALAEDREAQRARGELDSDLDAEAGADPEATAAPPTAAASPTTAAAAPDDAEAPGLAPNASLFELADEPAGAEPEPEQDAGPAWYDEA